MSAKPPAVCRDLDFLVSRLRGLVDSTEERVIVGVTGAPGAGKTTLVESLLSRLPRVNRGSPRWAAHVPMDGFHLANVTLDQLGIRDRKGAPESFDVGGYLTLLSRIRTDKNHVIYAPAFERTIEQPIAGSIAIDPSARLVLTEGNYLLHSGAWAKVSSLLDQVWYCDVSDELRTERLISRHVQFGKSVAAARSWVQRVDEQNAVAIMRARNRADLIVSCDS